MFKSADSVPDTDGVKTTAIEHLAPADTAVPQLFVCEKSAAFVPLNASPMMGTAIALVLVNTTVCGELGVLAARLPKFKEEADTVTVITPAPESGRLCGLPLDPSVMVSRADSGPTCEGVKDSVMAQEPPAATDEPQLLVCEKSGAFGPVIAIFEITSATELVLLRFTVCGDPVIFTPTLPKFTVDKEIVTVTTPVPDRATV